MSMECSDGPATLRTLREDITLEEAMAEEHNMLHRLTYWQKRCDLLDYLSDHRADIEAVVWHHLNLNQNGTCCLAPISEWIHGSFNICLPINIQVRSSGPGKRVLIRFPLPFKIGEETFPGNADEKLRCEAATYIWIQENCPDVPIPQLLGFAFSGNQCFTALGRTSWYTRFKGYIRRQLRSLFGYAPLCRYVRQRKPSDLKHGYLLLDFIEDSDGIMLSESWEEKRQDKSRRTNLFKDLSRIMLSLGRIPLPRIGSFTLNDQGVLSLTNRPLTSRLQDLENEGVPTNIARHDSYSSVEPYMLDLLAYHDSLLRHRPNSINDQLDCRAQMAVLTAMRAVLPHFINRGLRNGPFLFTLTDIHQGNIFVDEEWHIKYLIDLEWACSLPMEMQNPPHWLTGRGVDQLQGEYLAEYDDVREEFMKAFENEERLQYGKSLEKVNLLRTRTMRRAWESGGYFYFHALESTTGLFNLFLQHIWPKFPASVAARMGFDDAVSPFWSFDTDNVTATKMKDREEYEARLQALFEAHAPNSPASIK